MRKTPLTLLIDFLENNKDVDVNFVITVADELRQTAEKHELLRVKMESLDPNISDEEYIKKYHETLEWYNSKYSDVEEKKEENS